MRKILSKFKKRPIVALVAILALSVLVFTAAPAQTHAATSKNAACQGVGLADGSGNCSGGGGASLSNVIQVVVNIISGIVGVVAVVMIIVGGFKYITSGGEANSVASAKNTIIYAVVGLVIVALAQVIVHFVINDASNAATPHSATTSIVLHKHFVLL